MSGSPTRIEVGAESGSVILSDLISCHHLVSAYCSPSANLLRKCNSAYVGQWCPNGLDGKNQEVECHQQKIDLRLSDVRSSLKVALCTK